MIPHQNRHVLFLALLVGLAWPLGAWAAAPVVSNYFLSIGPNTGGHDIYFRYSTSWTGSITALTFTNLSLSQHGTVTHKTNDYYRYTCSSKTYKGSDSFTWRAANGAETSVVATCFITISNHVPVALPVFCTAAPGEIITPLVDLSANYTHDFGDCGTTPQPISYLLTTQAVHGAAYFDPANGQSGWMDYAANDSFVGTDVFYWAVSDGMSTSVSAAITIAVGVAAPSNDVPVALPISCTVVSGVTMTPLADLATQYTHNSNDNWQTISYLLMSPPAHGSAWLETSPPAHGAYPTSGQYGYVDYVSTPGFCGTDLFYWAVSDGVSTSAPALVTVTVTPAPPIPANQNVVAAKNTPVAITPTYAGGGGYTCSLVMVSGPLHGAVTTNGMLFRYTPNNPTNYFGTDSFTWKMAYANGMTPLTNTATVTCSIMVKDASTNADWPQWRFDECRMAQSPAVLPDQLYLRWRREVPTCAGSFGDVYDSYYGNSVAADLDNIRPVQSGKTLYVSLMANDSVSAYDTDTGALKWRAYTGGALRRPPVAVALTNGTNAVIFGCDDGNVYCLNAADGSVVWKFQAAPNSKKAMGYGRLSSVWPIWASPVVYSNKVYFAAGHIPTWKIWVYCLDAVSGSVIWCNDGRLMVTGNANANIATLGPLAFSANHTQIYGTTEGKGRHWAISPITGDFMGYVGSGFNCKDPAIPPPPLAEHWFIDGSGKDGYAEPMAIVAGGRTFIPQDVYSLGVLNGTIGSMLAGDGKLFVATTEGSIYCFGAAATQTNYWPNTVTSLPATNDIWTSVAQNMLSRDDLKQGLALVWGVGSGRLVEELAKQGTGLMIVAADPDPEKLLAIRTKMDAAGWSGARVSTLQGNPMDCGFAPYQAALIASEDVTVAGFSNGAAMVQMVYQCTRPFGGEIWLPTSNTQYSAITNWLITTTKLPLCDVIQRTEFAGLNMDGFTQIRRLGLPDDKQILKPPFRLTAFGPVAGGFIAKPTACQKGVKDGFDIYSWLPASTNMPGYAPPPPLRNNVRASIPSLNATLPNALYARPEQKPATFGSTSCSVQDLYGALVVNPGKIGFLVNVSNYWGCLVLPEISGCQGVARGLAGSGFAGNGMAAVMPAFGCMCNAGMAYTQIGITATDDPGEEYWVNYQLARSTRPIWETPVRKVGVNFGAPGDRYVEEEQLLWTHQPGFGRTGEATPLLPVDYRGNVKSMYHNSEQMAQTGGRYRGWVSASQVTGMNGLTIHLASPLVAHRITTPPTIDGLLSDGCWTNQTWVTVPLFPKISSGVQTSASIMICYDDTNLYIAGTNLPHYLAVSLNSREMRTSTVGLVCDASGKSSVGIAANAWQAAYINNSQAEMTIPWAALAAAGLWKEQLVMNVGCWYSIMNGSDPGSGDVTSGTGMGDMYYYFSPVYLDAPRGAVTNVTPHTVRLYFAEMEGKTNDQRRFDVKVQGQTVLTNFDVVAQAGGAKREVMREFQNVSLADHLDIDFANVNGEPMLSGAEIIDTQTNQAGAHVDPPNAPPLAMMTLIAGVTNGPAPLDVTFSARSSCDPDGQIVECAWETGDGRLARGSLLHHIFAEPGSYTVNLLVLDNRGSTGTTNMTVTVTPGVPSAFVCNIRSNGANSCDYTSLSAWNTAISDDLTSTSNRLFIVSGRGNYSTNDDCQPVNFSGGGTGTLKHITTNNIPNIAYIAGCGGTIQTGTVRCTNSGHTFSIVDTGSPIVTAVAQCYNDWPEGLNDTATLNGWTVDENHSVSVRTAPGHGHTGKMKDSNGNYTGFAVAVLNPSAVYTRIENIIVYSGNMTIGTSGSINRVLCHGTVTAGGAGVTIANSVGAALNVSTFTDVSLYNCTANTIALGNPASHLRAVNCLAWATNNTGFSPSSGTPGYWASHCVSMDSTATNFDSWQEGNEGNQAKRTVTFVNTTNDDYQLAVSDTGARGLGQPGLGADVAGNTRTGPVYDIGASQTINALSAFQQWQMQYYHSTTDPMTASNVVNCAGISNWQMFLAGSNPNDSNTWFQFTLITPVSGNKMGMNFNTVSGKVYTVNWRTNLLDGMGWLLYTNLGGLGGNAYIVFTNNLPQAFFQIQTQ